jgi:type I restriction enzyme S subunit
MTGISWRPTSIGAEIELAYGKGLPNSVRTPGPFRVYGSNGVVGTHEKSLIDGPGIIVGRKGSVGRVAFSHDPFWPIDTTYYVVNRKDHNWRYLYFLLQSLGLEDLNSHSAVPGLNRENVYGLPVLLPARAEQDRIATCLSMVVDAKDANAAALSHAHAVKHAMMDRLFSRGLRSEAQEETEIGSMPKGWRVVPLSAHLERAQYGLSIKGHLVGEYPILRMNCQIDGRVVFRDLQYVDLEQEMFEAFRVDDGDLLFNRTNSYELVGRTAIFRSARDAVFASYLIRLTLDSDAFVPEFVNYYLNRESTQAELKKLASRGVSQANISASKLKEFLVPWAPLDEQHEIVDVVETIDRKIDLHKRKRDLLDELFRSLLHKLMTGEIRVNDLSISGIAQ